MLLVAGGASAVAALGLCAVLTYLTDSGAVGFGVALLVLMVGGIGVASLRELRRARRGIRRLEAEGRDMARRHRALKASAESLAKELSTQQSGLQVVLATQVELTRAVNAEQAHQLHVWSSHLSQLQASHNLFALGPTRVIMPPMGAPAVAGDVIALLVSELLRIRPRLVVVCDSRTSTVWLAHVIHQHDLSTRVVSLHCERADAVSTQRDLDAQGTDHHVDVRFAPLSPSRLISQEDVNWYAEFSRDDLDDIGLLFVAGPSADTGPLARYPAVPVLRRRFSPTAVVVIDNLAEPRERETAGRWRIQLPDFDVEEIAPPLGVAVFRREAESSQPG